MLTAGRELGAGQALPEMGFLLLEPLSWTQAGIHLVFPNAPLPSQQGEKILKLAEICRKFETEEEKVLPFYSSVLTPMEQEEVERQNPEELTEELAKVKDGEGGGWAAFAQGDHHTPPSSASALR